MTLPLTKVFVIDFEGLGLESRWNPSLSIYFCCILTVDNDGRKQINKHFDVIQAIEHARQLINEGWTMIAHNAKFELSVMSCRGYTHIIEKGVLSVADTMVMEYFRNTGLPSYSLDALTGLKTDVVQEAVEKGLLPEGVKKSDFWSTDWSKDALMIEHIADYCVQDCKATWSLYKRLCAWYNLPENTKFKSSLLELEFPMLSVLTHMEVQGIHVDTEALDELTKDCSNTLALHKKELDKVAKFLPQLSWRADEDEFTPKVVEYKAGVYKNIGNIRHYVDSEGKVVSSVSNLVGSHCVLKPYNAAAATGHTYWLIKQQCPEILEKAERTPKGKFKLNKDFFADVSEELPDSLPIAKYLKATKDLQICVSIAEHVRDRRIHGSFNNCFTRTARLSSSAPNLQNIPRSTSDPTSVGSRFRQLFSKPAPDKIMLVADLDRIELVVLAWYLLVSQKDSGLAEVCNTPGADPHQTNADRWKVSRIIAKTLIFLLVYGGGAGLIFRRGMSPTLKEAEQMVKEVDKQQPSINKLKKSVWAKCRERGFITNPFNARGVYPELYSNNGWERGAGERKSFNFLIQRTARDVLHTLVVASFPVILKYGARLVNIVHDEIIIECDVDISDALMLDLYKVWHRREDILKGVVINGDWNKGNNWYEAK